MWHNIFGILVTDLGPWHSGEEIHSTNFRKSFSGYGSIEISSRKNEDGKIWTRFFFSIFPTNLASSWCIASARRWLWAPQSYWYSSLVYIRCRSWSSGLVRGCKVVVNKSVRTTYDPSKNWNFIVKSRNASRIHPKIKWNLPFLCSLIYLQKHPDSHALSLLEMRENIKPEINLVKNVRRMAHFQSSKNRSSTYFS